MNQALELFAQLPTLHVTLGALATVIVFAKVWTSSIMES